MLPWRDDAIQEELANGIEYGLGLENEKRNWLAPLAANERRAQQ